MFRALGLLSDSKVRTEAPTIRFRTPRTPTTMADHIPIRTSSPSHHAPSTHAMGRGDHRTGSAHSKILWPFRPCSFHASYCARYTFIDQVSIFKRTSFVSRSRYTQYSSAHSQLTDLSSHADSKESPLQPAQGVSNKKPSQQLSWAVPSFMFSVVRPDRYHLRPAFSKTPFKVPWRTVAATPLHARSTAFAPRQSIPFSQVAHLRRMRPVGASLLRQGGLLITAPRCSDGGACSSRRLAAQTGGLLLR